MLRILKILELIVLAVAILYFISRLFVFGEAKLTGKKTGAEDIMEIIVLISSITSLLLSFLFVNF